MPKYYVMYRLNKMMVVVEANDVIEADRIALATRGKAWVYRALHGWWYVTAYKQHFQSWKIGKGKNKGGHNYYDVTQLRPAHEVPEEFKLCATILSN